jgi:hypothetical protein
MWHMARATGNPSLLLSPLGKYSEFTHFPSLFHAPAPSPIPLVFSLTNGPFSFSFHYLSLSYALFFINLFYLPSPFLLFHIEEIPYFIYYNAFIFYVLSLFLTCFILFPVLAFPSFHLFFPFFLFSSLPYPSPPSLPIPFPSSPALPFLPYLLAINSYFAKILLLSFKCFVYLSSYPSTVLSCYPSICFSF